MKKMSEPARKNDRMYTYADYCTWPDDERWELIDGAAYDMSPAPNRRHQEIVGEVYRQLSNYLRDKPCRVFIAPFDVRLLGPARHPVDTALGPTHHPGHTDREHTGTGDDEITTVVQPDVSVFCDESKLDERGAIGAPDLVVEVLSPATSVKDQREKLKLYERSAVQEYWIIDPVNRLMWVYRLETADNTQPTGAQSKHYRRPEVYGPEDTFESRVLEGFSLELPTLFTA
jgi:Uma2 family endonuclease